MRMSERTNAQVWLKSRPNGVPQRSDFGIRMAAVPQLAEGQLLIRNEFLSVDPAMRGWICDAGGYSVQIALGETIRAFAVGEVIESNNARYPSGARVMGLFGWQEYAVVLDNQVLLTVPSGRHTSSLYLGVLGLNGYTAYFGLLEIGQPRKGENVLVSTAAGAVGSCVGQIAKVHGCRTVGITGGALKVSQCIEEFGYAAAIDYKGVTDLDSAIRDACPSGVDVYFDNTSGPISDAVLRHLNIGARIVVCGTAAYPSWTPWNRGPRPERHLLVKRARMQGFLVTDFTLRYTEALHHLSKWVEEGAIHYREQVLEGIEQAPGAIQRLYNGENTGKLVIRLPGAQATA